jgi:3-oxoacyl-(acyl-carrier-protein) synthase
MSVRIAGLGWVTPHGAELAGVWQRIVRREPAPHSTIRHPATGRDLLCARIPQASLDHLARHPRLRRSSVISYAAVAAGLAALADAGLATPPGGAALIFAIGDGGVIYTRRFYEQIAREGAHAASPLLFPETVHNAPASHLAAQLGVDGATYTLVGDATVGLAALKMAGQLLDLGAAAHCIVVGCEEIDWILCEAYREWRLAATPAHPERGALLAEGAAALVLTRQGRRAQCEVHAGVPFFRRTEAAAALDRVLADLAPHAPFHAVVSCRNHTFIDAIESAALRKHAPDAQVYAPKETLGEALGAGALQQVLAATLALEAEDVRRILVPVIGWNQQASGAVIEGMKDEG